MTKNIAHRGFSGRYPENTMLSFKKAKEAGADGIELDVQLTKDGVPVIIHNEKVNKTTNGKGFVRDFTLEEIKQLDASAKFRGIYGKNEIPTLQEYFEFIAPTELFTDVELKTYRYPYPGIEEKVVALIDEYDLRNRVMISSFNHESILRVKELAPDIMCGYLEKQLFIDMAWYTRNQGIESINPRYNMVTQRFARTAKNINVEVYAWTVNREKKMFDLLEKGVDAIINNYPDLCREVMYRYYNGLQVYSPSWRR